MRQRGEAGGRLLNGLAVYDTVSHSLRYQIPVFNLAAVRVADVEGDGALELVYGDAQWGGVHVLDGATGSEKWEVDNPEHGVTDIAVGDVDGDGTAEILFGAGYSSTGPDHLYVVDALSRTIVWQSLDESGPHSGFAFGDVDADGALELVHTSYESDSGYADGLYFVHDAVTKALEYRSGPVNNSNWTGVSRVRAVNVDADPQLELLVASGISSYQGAVYCLDGLSHAVQWTAAVDDGLSVRSLQADLEGDGSLEVVGTYKEHSGAPGHFVYVFDAVTGALEWRDPLATTLWPNSSLLRVANVDADPALEIVLSVFGGPLWIVDGETRVVQLTLASLGATALEAADRDGDGRAEILVGDGQDASGGRQRNGALRELGSFGGQINGLAVSDLTRTARRTSPSAWPIACGWTARAASSWPRRVLGNAAGAHDSVSVGDVDGDGATEIVVNQGDFGLLVLEAVVEADPAAPVVSLTAPCPGRCRARSAQALAGDAASSRSSSTWTAGCSAPTPAPLFSCRRRRPRPQPPALRAGVRRAGNVRRERGGAGRRARPVASLGRDHAARERRDRLGRGRGRGLRDRQRGVTRSSSVDSVLRAPTWDPTSSSGTPPRSPMGPACCTPGVRRRGPRDHKPSNVVVANTVPAGEY
jgi:outer membrane protein assembly factor BamB